MVAPAFNSVGDQKAYLIFWWAKSISDYLREDNGADLQDVSVPGGDFESGNS
jgi:hypothetical protein